MLVTSLVYHTLLASTLCGLSRAPPAGTRLPAAPQCPGAPGTRSALSPLHSPKHFEKSWTAANLQDSLVQGGLAIGVLQRRVRAALQPG